MKKLIMLMLCFGMVCMLVADASTDTYTPATNTELPTNASPFQLQNSQMRRVPDSRVLLYSQIPTNSANSYACQLDSVYPFDADLVEDVTPTADWTVDSIVSYVRPWGAWSSWNLVPNVRFLVYADSSIGSHPVDSPFVEIIVNQGTYETAVYGSGWLVGVPVSPPIVLSAGVTYWLEVQPCHSFAANGQTGTMSEPGIGNGVEFFYRFPALGVPVFVPASAGGWPGCEGGIEIYGTAGGTLTDAATTAIFAPPASVPPNTVLAPSARYRNNSTSQQTFDCYFTIDSLGTPLYSQTANVTLGSATDTTIVWTPNWTAGPIDGIVYDITAWVVLAGDENPANDTLTSTTTTISSFWESFAAMPAARSGPYAGWYLDGSGVLTVHVFGGNPGPVSTHYIWDHASNSWSTGTALPATANYGGHVTVGECIYMVGARQAPGEGLITIYDVPGDAYTTVNLPGTIGDPACAVKDNNLIYIVGGCRPTGWTATTHVMLYDIAADSFYTAVTQLPGATARTCAAAAIIGDTIYVAGGIDGGGSNTNQFVVGYIDPGNPANITWATGIDKPGSTVYRLNGGPVFDDAGNGVFYIAGGDPFTTETYAYTPGSGWTTCSNKITAVSNWGCAIAPSPISDDAEWIMYAAGGYSPYQSVFEGYHTGTVTGIKEMPNEQINAFSFKITSPNPISSRASFAFSMPHRGEVTFNIYDVSGRNVLDSYYSNISQGEHTLFWDLKDNAHRDVASGIYLYRMETGTYHAEGKLVVVR